VSAMKKIINLMMKDFVSGTRNRMIQFMIAAPLLFTVIVKLLFMPTVDDTAMRLVISPALPVEMERHLSEFFRTERLESLKAVNSRVEENDAVFGVDYSDGKVRVIFQGNESDALKTAVPMIVSVAVAGTDGLGEVDSLGKEKSNMQEFISSLLTMIVLSISGMMTGFIIVMDKETRMIKALSVAPLTISDYLFSKMFQTIIYCFVFSIVIYWILFGFTINLVSWFLSFTAFSVLGIFLGFLIGTLAENENSAIALIKGLGFILLMLPMVSLFIPQTFQWPFYILPTYWVFRIVTIQALGLPGNIYLTWAVAMVYHIVLLAVLFPVMSRKLRMRKV